MSSILCQPRNAPSMAAIFQSPWPSPSTPARPAVGLGHRAEARGSPPAAESAASSGGGRPGQQALASSPAAMPGSVITSGRRWWSRSMRLSTSSAVTSAISDARVRGCGP